ETAHLVSLTQLVVRCRSAVERDGYSREVELIPEPEAPARLVVVLERLLAGLDALGVERIQSWAIVTKAALDCIPAVRHDALRALCGVTHELKRSQVAEAISYPTQTSRRALEDLGAHGIAIRESGGGGKADVWRLSDFARAHYAAALTFPETSGDVYSA